MKRNAILLLALALLAAACIPVSATTVPTVTVSNYTVNPSVLMPGGLGTITIILKNTATSATVTDKTGQYTSGGDYNYIKTTDINVNIQNVHMEGNGIIVLTSDFSRIGEIGPGQSIPLTFAIEAPSQNGMYYPEVWTDTYGGTSTRYPIPVNVNTSLGIQKAAILIMDSSLPESVNPGDEIPVTITVMNSGQFLADDVTLKITNVSGSIAPKNTDLYHIGRIDYGEQKNISFVLLSDKQADIGLIRVPVLIAYNSLDGKPLTQTSGIDVKMLGKAELGFVSVDTNPPRLSEGTPFDLTVRIENTGTGEAKQVSAKIDLPVEGTREAFIGKIKPGNDAPALFLLEGLKGGNYPYNLTITYTDDLGVHTMTREMNMRVPPADNSGTIILAVIVLGVLAFVAYRYWYLPKKNGDGKLPWVKKN